LGGGGMSSLGYYIGWVQNRPLDMISPLINKSYCGV